MRVEVVTVAVALAAWVLGAGEGASAGGPQPKTIAAWNAYVAATETRIASELGAIGPFLVSDHTDDRDAARDAITKGAIPIGTLSTVDRFGRTLEVPGGTIAHWRGAVLLPGMSLDSVLLQTCCEAERKPTCCGPQPVPGACGCGGHGREGPGGTRCTRLTSHAVAATRE